MLSYEHILQIIALITGLICWQKLNPAYLRLLVVLMALTCLNESVIIQEIAKGKIKTSFDLAYNIFSLFDMSIWFYIFYKFYQQYNETTIVLVFICIAFIFTAAELFGYRSWLILHRDSFRVYSFFIIYLSVNYLYRILKVEKYYNIFSDHTFFLCAACLTYQSMEIIIFSTLSENSFWKFKEADYVYNLLQVITNVFYYTLICIAFITASRNRNYYKSAFQT